MPIRGQVASFADQTLPCTVSLPLVCLSVPEEEISRTSWRAALTDRKQRKLNELKGGGAFRSAELLSHQNLCEWRER